MQVRRVNLQPAYVLHRRPYRNNSLLIELLTREYGRVGAVARGARQLKSRYLGLLAQFQPLLVSWSGKGELGTINLVERDGGATLLHGNRLACGFYVNELLMRLTHREDPSHAVYLAYTRVLAALADGQGDSETALRLFEKDLLEALGYGLALTADAESGEAIRAECVYNYFLDKGPVAAQGDETMPHGEREVIRLRGSSLIALAQGDLDDASVRREVKRLTRMTLGRLLGSKPLNSRSLFRDRIKAGSKTVDTDNDRKQISGNR